MCIPYDMEPVNKMTDKGSFFLINEHEVPRNGLRVEVDEEMGILTFQNHGANTIWGPSWTHVQAETLKMGVILPEELAPCGNCNGKRCRFSCTRH